MEIKDKRFFSKIPGAKFIQPDGFEMEFRYGFFDFKQEDYPGSYIGNHKEDPRNGKPKATVYFEELETIVRQKGGNPLFFDQQNLQSLATQPAPIPKVDPTTGKPFEAIGRSEAEISAQDQNLSNMRNRVSGEENNGAINVNGGNVNESTINHELRQKVADFNNAQVGGSKADQLKAAAEARAAQSATSVSR